MTITFYNRFKVMIELYEENITHGKNVVKLLRKILRVIVRVHPQHIEV